jgi:AraC-like DNA-binding protein
LPLYIDLHIDNKLTPDLVKQFHVADKAIQAKYGVRYLQILLNQPQGYLFCLVEGPDKESCARVHQEAHGQIACNILEITDSDFSALLANKKKDAFDFTLNNDGTVDTGTRAMLVVDFVGNPESYADAREKLKRCVQEGEGLLIEGFGDHLVGVFQTSTAAIDAAIVIQQSLGEFPELEVRLGIELGNPIESSGSFFEDTHRAAARYTFMCLRGQITVSNSVLQSYNGNHASLQDKLNVIPARDEKFVAQLMDCVERVWDNSEISITEFSTEIGISKSQLTRKLNSLAGLSPNDFLKEFRLRKSFRMLEDRKHNIAEITMAIGFSNPSYFTQCFRKRFGKAPSDFLTHNAVLRDVPA